MIPHLRHCFILLLFIMLLSSCSSSYRETNKLGIKSVPRDASSILGTYANLSHDSRPRLRLWEIVSDSSSHSQETDRVQILSAGPRKIRMRLLRDGRRVDEVTSSYSPHSNHLMLRNERKFGLLPFGFYRQRHTVSLSSTSDGELVAVTHSSAFGLVLFYSAGDGSTHAYRFMRAAR